jgi:hypothetical protein
MSEESKYGLIDIVKKDGSLKKEDKLAFLSLAKLYESDFKKNLRLTSLELDEEYETSSPSLWRKFLAHTSVKNLIEDYRYEVMGKKAMDVLEYGMKDSNKALKVKETVDKKNKKDSNNNIVVMLLPHKKDDIGL